MALPLPKFIVIRSHLSRQYLRYMTESWIKGYVTTLEPDVFNLLSKIEVERATIDSRFVHLRFSHTNRYWARESLDKNNSWILASSTQPEEDRSKLSCTLFEPFSRDDGTISFRHVQSGGLLRAFAGGMIDTDSWVRVMVEDGNVPFVNHISFTVIDWDTLVMMPELVAFKGYNDMYLKAGWIERHEYLQFSSEDSNEKAAGYEVTMLQDGHIRIKSHFFGKFWRRSPNWIWADSTDYSNGNNDTLFWPVKVNDNTIALRNAGNNRFCSSLTAERKTDCLNAAVATITREARLQVEELVFDRYLLDVIYRLDDARIFDERPIVAGRGSAENESSETSTLTVRVAYEENRSYSFSNSLSIMAGVRTSITTGIPRIAEGKIEISAEITNSFEWNRTTSETILAEATYMAVVPPRSRVRVNYIATQGTCNIPFSYTQRDRLSQDGSIVSIPKIDGIFTGVNYYSFHFAQPEIEPF